ncbi:MAG TPA: condensation domain-containing protein, partial [Ktedonobacteraceae bacterium]
MTDDEDLINEENMQLLALLLEEEGLSIPQNQEISVQAKTDYVPLSFAQQRLWVLDQLEPGNVAYTMPTAIRLQGTLHVAALETSLNEIVRRHEVLRTTFPLVEGQPVQAIHSYAPLTLPVIDLRALTDERQQAQLQRLMRESAGIPFELAQGPLLRVQLMRVTSQEHVLLLLLHHSVFDGWSLGILLRELSELYRACVSEKPSPLSALSIQYVDYTLWQRATLQGEALSSELAYWQTQLAGAPLLFSLPTDHPRPAVLTYQGDRQIFMLPRSLVEELNALSQREGVTFFMTLLAAWQALLWRYSGQNDFLIGTPIANRTHMQLEELIGCFVNMLVLRCDLSGDPSFRQLLARVRETALQAYAHQDLPFEQLIEALQPRRDVSHAPVVQVVFVLQNAPAQSFDLPGLRLEPLEVEQTTARFELMLTLLETAQGLQAVVEYNTALFEAETIARMAGHYRQLLEGIVIDQVQSVSRLPLLSAREQKQVLALGNPTPRTFQREHCLHELFEEQAALRPDALALSWEEEHLSYQELNSRANCLARALVEQGVKPESRVGLCLERSLDLVIGLLAILKAGGAYVPLDPAYPAERLAFLLTDARITVLLTHS